MRFWDQFTCLLENLFAILHQILELPGGKKKADKLISQSGFRNVIFATKE